MKPYPESITNTGHKSSLITGKQSKGGRNAFGRLKKRWRFLSKRLDCKLGLAVNTVAACVTLHNMCETFGNPLWKSGEQRRVL